MKLTNFGYLTVIGGLALAGAATWRWFLWSAFPDTSQLVIYLIASAGIIFAGIIWSRQTDLEKKQDKLRHGLEFEGENGN